MAFAVKNFDSKKSGVYGTALVCGDFIIPLQVNYFFAKLGVMANWNNLGNYSTAGTSGGSGTTIIAAGDYTWIG